MIPAALELKMGLVIHLLSVSIKVDQIQDPVHLAMEYVARVSNLNK